MQPLVSILINNYNYERYVGEAIESALSQSYPHCEVIVVDDGSTDGSRDIISSFKSQAAQVFKKNGGQASAFNTGFARCSGEIVCLLDADDLFLPDKVQHAVDAFRRTERQWHFHRLQWTDATLAPIPMPSSEWASGDYDYRAECRRGTLRFSPPATSGLSFTRRLLEQILPMPETITITSDNFIKYAAMAMAPGYFSADQIALQRIHGANAYTRRDNDALQATVLMNTAAGLRERVPSLRAACNRMYAEGLVRTMSSGSALSRLYTGHCDYLRSLPLPDRAAILFRTICKAAKRRVSVS